MIGSEHKAAFSNGIHPPGSARPRMLLVAPYYRPTSYGGAVQLYHQTLVRLRSLEAVVVTQRQGGSDLLEMERFDRSCPLEYGYQMRRIKRFEFNFAPQTALGERLIDACRFFVETRAQWRAVIREVRPDVIVCGATYIAGWLLSQTPGSLPLVNYLHGEELAAANPSRFMQPVLRRNQIGAIRKAALNICVSRYTADNVIKLAGIERDRIVVLPNFVDTERFSPPADREALRRQLGWQNKRIILTLARLMPRKGVDQAIRALAALRAERRLSPDWMHVIAGRGEQERELRALVTELGAEDYTRFEGFVPEDRVPSYFGAADIFLQPNRDLSGDTEGFGIVFIEASACGTPVIGGVAGGTADAIREGVSGFRVDAENVSSISHAVHLLTGDDELRRRMGLSGKDIVDREHRIERGSPV